MISASCCGTDLNVKVWKFPCGEVGVKIENASKVVLAGEHIWVHLDWQGNDDLMALAQVVDIVKAAGARSWSLDIPYFPYGRQDRRCSPGEAHALKVFATILNSFKFSVVRTFDPHSYVLEALVDNLVTLTQSDCAYDLPMFEYLVAPDAGAEKKIFTNYVANFADGVLCASKVRAPDGKILSTTLHGGEAIEGKTVCVMDDICDGGATFIELGKVLSEYNPKTLCLYVTHGMFTKGVDELLGLYDTIYTANLCNKSPEVVSRVITI